MGKLRRLGLLTLLLIAICSLPPWNELRHVTERHRHAAPVNPGATAEARELLARLYASEGEGLLAGQHDYLESPEEFNEKLEQISGRRAVLHGYELGAIMGQTEDVVAAQRKAVVESAMRRYEEGGIVVMTFHQNLPGTERLWDNVSMKLEQRDFDRYVTEGTPEYDRLIADLDETAVYLAQLRDAGVPVLWRPYHEMNGDWFWWGGKNNFTALWEIMYTRYTETHGLNNLLWVWNPNAPTVWAEPYGAYFPGLDRADILAADIYEEEFKPVYYEGLLKLADGKPIGIGESGVLPDATLLMRSQPRWVYMMTWGSMLTENNSPKSIRDFMEHPHTVSKEEYALLFPKDKDGLH